MSALPQATDTAAPAALAHRAAFGIWSAITTPLDDDLGIAHGAFARHVRQQLDDGCHGVTVFGTTGEAASFSVDERIAALDAVLESGVPVDRLMVGTGTCSLTDTVRLTAHAVASGVRRVMMLPPFYFKDADVDGLFASYAAVFERVADPGLRVFLYHYPRMSGIPIAPALIERLLDAYPELVVGIKDSTGDWSSTEGLCTRFPALAVFPGDEKLLLAGLRHGGVGTITAGANGAAAALRAAFDAWASGDGTADAAQEKVTRIRRAVDTQPMVPGLKYLLAERYGDPGWRRVRPPLVALDDAAGRALVAAVGAAAA